MKVDEGYIKYSAMHEKSSGFEALGWEELNEARSKCYKLGLVGVYQDGIGYGNLSIRYKGEEFFISGTATGSKPVLACEDYCLVRSFNIARNSVNSQGPVQASSESMTHGAIYRARHGVNCVIHIHSKKIYDSMIKDNYPSTPKNAAFGTPDIALAVEKCAETIGKDEGQIVLAGHDEGIIAYGANIERALELIMELYIKYGG